MGFQTGHSTGKQASVSYTPEQKKWLGKALQTYGPTLGQGTQSYPGQTVAPMTGIQTNAMNAAGGYTNWLSPDAGIPMYNETGQALSGALAGTSGAQPITEQQTNEYFQRTLKDPYTKSWGEEIAPAIREEYAGPGYWSSARAGAVGKSAQELGNWLGTQKANLDWNTLQSNQGLREAAANRALGAVQPAMAYGQMPTQEAAARTGALSNIYGMGAQGQQQNQAEINAAVQRFAEQNQITNPEDIQILMSLLNMDYQFSKGSQFSSNWGFGLGG